MTIHGSLFTEFKEKDTQDPFSLQNKKLLRIDMRYGEVMAKTGSMVAYQGDVRFTKQSSGLGKMFKSAMTGEGVSVMTCSGSGELFVADSASEIQVMYLENDAISVNGSNILAFSNSIQWDIHRIQARGAAMTGGLYNVSLRGTGYVAVTTKGDPVALDVASAPTRATSSCSPPSPWWPAADRARAPALRVAWATSSARPRARRVMTRLPDGVHRAGTTPGGRGIRKNR